MCKAGTSCHPWGRVAPPGAGWEDAAGNPAHLDACPVGMHGPPRAAAQRPIPRSWTLCGQAVPCACRLPPTARPPPLSPGLLPPPLIRRWPCTTAASTHGRGALLPSQLPPGAERHKCQHGRSARSSSTQEGPSGAPARAQRPVAQPPGQRVGGCQRHACREFQGGQAGMPGGFKQGPSKPLG